MNTQHDIGFQLALVDDKIGSAAMFWRKNITPSLNQVVCAHT